MKTYKPEWMTRDVYRGWFTRTGLAKHVLFEIPTTRNLARPAAIITRLDMAGHVTTTKKGLYGYSIKFRMCEVLARASGHGIKPYPVHEEGMRVAGYELSAIQREVADMKGLNERLQSDNERVLAQVTRTKRLKAANATEIQILTGTVNSLDSIEGSAARIVDPGPCIYFLLRGKKIVYVGQSINFYSRVGQHLHDPGKSFNRVAVLQVDKDNINAIERLYISMLRPEHNSAGINPDPTSAMRVANQLMTQG